MKYLSIKQLKELQQQQDNLVILDTRNRTAFTEGFIPGAIFAGHDGKMTDWVATLFAPATPIVLVAPTGKELEIYEALAAKNFTNIVGILDGGFEHWVAEGEPIDLIINVDADELAMDIPFDEKLVIVDVRTHIEYADGHVKDATNLPLDEMKDLSQVADLEEHQNIYLHCASGYRSVIAASIFKFHGYNNIRNVTGGWESIKHTKGFKTEKEKSALN